MREYKISSNEAGQRFDKYLAKLLNEAPKSFLYKMLRKKNITLNYKKADGSEKLQIEDTVILFLKDETIEQFQSKKLPQKRSSKHSKVKLDMIYEDSFIALINKPAGMLSQKGNDQKLSLVEYFIDYMLDTGELKEEDLQTFRPSVCNRLDCNTSGIVAAGKTLSALQDLSEFFRERTLHKYYLTIVKGRISEKKQLKGWLFKDPKTNKVEIRKNRFEEADNIETIYTPLRSNGAYTLLQVELITGKTHQIRAHLAWDGHPILGDPKYGDYKLNQEIKKKCGINRQLLHAFRLEFPEVKGTLQYLSGKSFEAAYPDDFHRAIDKLLPSEVKNHKGEIKL